MSGRKLLCRGGHRETRLRIDNELGLGLCALTPQRFGLSLAATFGDRFGEVGKQDGEPQPQDDLELEAELPATRDEIADKNDRGQDRDDLENEDDRILG